MLRHKNITPKSNSKAGGRSGMETRGQKDMDAMKCVTAEGPAQYTHKIGN